MGELGIDKGDEDDGIDRTQDRGGPKDGQHPNR